MIPKINSFAQSTGGTASVGEDFDMSIFHFIYDQNQSQNPPFGYVITEEAIDALGDSMLNDLKMCFSSVGVLMKWDLAWYLDFVWNSAYANGTLSEFVHQFNNSTTIYYYLLDDDGDIFNWCFEWLGMTFTLQLDENGLPWTNGKGQPNGNVKHTSEFLDLIGQSKNDQSIDGKMYNPRMKLPSIEDLNPPYIKGKSLYFTVYNSSVPTVFCFEDFENTLLSSTGYNISSYITLFFWNGKTNNVLRNVGTNQTVTLNLAGSQGYNHGLSVSGYSNSFSVSNYFGNGVNLSFNLPCYNVKNAGTNINFYAENISGFINNEKQSSSGYYIFLAGSNYYPVTNPTSIVIPEDDPISLPDIGDWIDENEPDEDPQPNEDPITIDPFVPVPPDPDPEPAPPVPSIVSGNDDLWPDMNEIFNTEAEMDSFLTPLSNFEFTSLANLTDEFSASIVWVSTIMMSLYNGSEYSVLFSILAIFFIACALLGIYKWWSS